MQTKAMSTGASLASCCASVTCSARTGTVNSGTSRAWGTRRPPFLMCSTSSGHGSMNGTSSPACTMCAPAYPPTAPAPTMAIFRPMLFLPVLLSAGAAEPGGLIATIERRRGKRQALFVDRTPRESFISAMGLLSSCEPNRERLGGAHEVSKDRDSRLCLDGGDAHLWYRGGRRSQGSVVRLNEGRILPTACGLSKGGRQPGNH